MLLKTKQWAEIVKAVPFSIEKIMDEPLVCDLVKQVGKETILQFLEAELIKLANQMNVANNLNATQVPFIAETLLEQYPTESLADFILCLKRGQIGFYGNTYHQLDCGVIMGWMAKHIDEKAIYREREHQGSKPIEMTSNAKPLSEETQKMVNDFMMSLPSGMKEVPKVSGKEIQEAKNRIAVKSVSAGYAPPSPEELELRELKKQWGLECHDLYTGKPLSNWVEFETWKNDKMKH